MAKVPENIHPVFDSLLNRESKEKLLNQNAKVIWFTGLSGSGKSTIAKGLENELHQLGHLTMVLDGDNVRSGINNNLGFSETDRTENIRRIAEVAKILLNSGVITMVFRLRCPQTGNPYLYAHKPPSQRQYLTHVAALFA